MILLSLFHCLLPNKNIERNDLLDLQTEVFNAFFNINDSCAIQHVILFEKLALQAVNQLHHSQPLLKTAFFLDLSIDFLYFCENFDVKVTMIELALRVLDIKSQIQGIYDPI